MVAILTAGAGTISAFVEMAPGLLRFTNAMRIAFQSCASDTDGGGTDSVCSCPGIVDTMWRLVHKSIKIEKPMLMQK